MQRHSLKAAFVLTVILLGAIAQSFGQPLIAQNAVWKYFANSAIPDANWMQPSFNDSGWLSGPAELGYGDSDEATVIPFGPDSANKWITSYYRHKFTVANPAAYDGLSMSLVYDDGAVIYINGRELYRINMPAGPVSWGTLGTAALTEPYPADVTTWSPTNLVTG